MTYSIVAQDADTGQLGVAVQSHFFGVGSIVPWARAGVGAVATQSFVQVSYGPAMLELLAEGRHPEAALSELVADDPMAEVRQVGSVDGQGRTAAYTGVSCVPFAGHLAAERVSAQANMMERSTVCEAMVSSFHDASGELPGRLLAALDAAEREGGDIRGRQSAALLVVAGQRSDHAWEGVLTDVRVEDHPDPLRELRRLVDYGAAYRSLGDALFQPGGVIGEYRLTDEQLEDGLDRLRAAQEIVEPNPEPTFWQGVLLARAGRSDAAREAFAAAAHSRDSLAEFARRLVDAGLIPAGIFGMPEQRT